MPYGHNMNNIIIIILIRISTIVCMGNHYYKTLFNSK